MKLVAELRAGVTTETEVTRIERGEEAGLADLGLRLDDAKQLTAALQAEMVAAQLAVVGERRRGCATCGRPLASKGHYRATFRSLFGDVPVRVRRLLVCPCRGPGEAKSFAAVDLGARVRPGTGLRDRQVRGPGAVRQGRGLSVRAAADQRGAERRHSPEQDVAGRPGRRAAGWPSMANLSRPRLGALLTCRSRTRRSGCFW